MNPKIPLGKGKVDDVVESETQDLLGKGKVVAKFTRGKEFEIIEKKAIKEVFGGSKIALKPDATVAITGVVKNVNAIKYLSKNSDNIWKTGINIGGMDILSSPKWFKIQEKYLHILSDNPSLYWKKVRDEFWETVNKPWVDDEEKITSKRFKEYNTLEALLNMDDRNLLKTIGAGAKKKGVRRVKDVIYKITKIKFGNNTYIEPNEKFNTGPDYFLGTK